MPSDDYVTLEGVECGVDSNSGAAYSCEIKGAHYWVPYSQTKERHLDRRNHHSDRIVVARWLAEKNGWL